MIEYILIGLPLGITAAGQPGPFQTYLLSQTMKQGFWPTLPYMFAPLISDGPIIVIVLVVLAQLPIWGLAVIRILGGVFLCYLAYEAYQALKNYQDASKTTTTEQAKGIARAALINALGPGPWLFWGTIAGPILIQGWKLNPLYAFGFLLGFYAALLGGFGLLVILFSLGRVAGSKASRWLLAMSAVILLGFGCYQIFGGIYSLIT